MENICNLNSSLIEALRSHKVTYRKKIDIPEDVKFGTEIEFTSKHSLKKISIGFDRPNFIIGYDGETPSDILEVKNKGPITNTQETWSELKDTLDLLKQYDAQVDDRVASHIHFDHSTISDNNLMNLLKFWYVFEDSIYQFCFGEFDHIRDCSWLFAEKLGEELKTYIDDFEKDVIDLSDFSRFNRGYGINLSNHLGKRPLLYKNTYEIRCPNGTLNEKIWQNYINFFSHIFIFCRKDCNTDYINFLYSGGKLDNSFENALILTNLLFSLEEEKLDFLKQYILTFGKHSDSTIMKTKKR